MRNIILLLLAANILFFLWPKENQEPRGPLTRGQGNLPLLIQLVEVDERPSPRSLVPEKFVPVVYEPPATVRVVAPKPEKTRIKAPVPPTVLAQNRPKRATPSGAGSAHPARTETGTTPSRSVSAPPKAEKTRPARHLSCYTLGPFDDRKSAQRAAEKLRGIGATASVRVSTERRIRGYWVYLPPSASREAALKRAEELAAKGFSDYFVVADGAHDNAISLGLFSLKKGSERRVAQLKSMGFRPRVEVRFTNLNVFWLDYEIDQEIDWPAFIRENFPNDRVDQLKRSCP